MAKLAGVGHRLLDGAMATVTVVETPTPVAADRAFHLEISGRWLSTTKIPHVRLEDLKRMRATLDAIIEHEGVREEG